MTATARMLWFFTDSSRSEEEYSKLTVTAWRQDAETSFSQTDNQDNQFDLGIRFIPAPLIRYVAGHGFPILLSDSLEKLRTVLGIKAL